MRHVFKSFYHRVPCHIIHLAQSEIFREFQKYRGIEMTRCHEMECIIDDLRAIENMYFMIFASLQIMRKSLPISVIIFDTIVTY